MHALSALLPRRGVVHVYKDSSGEWRWRGIANNEKIVVDSAESFTREHDAYRSARDYAPRRFYVIPPPKNPVIP